MLARNAARATLGGSRRRDPRDADQLGGSIDPTPTTTPNRSATQKANGQRRAVSVVLRPIPGTDPVRNLRGLLKVSLRRFGLRCISAIELPPGVAAMTARRRLENRRPNTTFELECAGLRYVCTIGRFADDSIGEVFLTNHRVNSHAGIMASDQAVLASLAIQFGCPIETLRKAIMRDSAGRPTSPIGAALDLIGDDK
jgi:hypothetical protein